jgi:hypothetical protein
MMWVIFMKVGSVLSLYLSEGQENEELFFLTMFPYCYSGDKIKNELGGACGMYGGVERCIQGFGGENVGKELTWKI